MTAEEINPKTINMGLTHILEQFARQRKEYEATKLKCGLVGRSGVGKSSLINAITGDKLAKVGAGKETTIEAHEYFHRGLVLVLKPAYSDASGGEIIQKNSKRLAFCDNWKVMSRSSVRNTKGVSSECQDTPTTGRPQEASRSPHR